MADTVGVAEQEGHGLAPRCFLQVHVSLPSLLLLLLLPHDDGRRIPQQASKIPLHYGPRMRAPPSSRLPLTLPTIWRTVTNRMKARLMTITATCRQTRGCQMVHMLLGCCWVKTASFNQLTGGTFSPGESSV
jgi:hypothetical protein